MQESQTQSRRVSEHERPYESNRSGLDHDVPHWEPDWWSRMMAIGSMLVAAAALWHARYPDSIAANPVTSASMVGDSDPGADNADNEPSVVDPSPEEDSQPVVKTEIPGVSGIQHAIATADKPLSDEGKKRRL